MTWRREVWDHLKNRTVEDIRKALERDGWFRDDSHGSALIYWRPGKARVSLHYHSGKTYGPKLLRLVLDSIGWTENDLRRLKLIKVVLGSRCSHRGLKKD